MNFTYQGMVVLKVGSFVLIKSIGQENIYETPDGFTVLVAPSLAEKGVRIDGTALHFGTENVAVFVEIDEDFKQVRVVEYNDKHVQRFWLVIKEDPEFKAKQAKWMNIAETFIDAIPSPGATSSLLADLMSAEWALIAVEIAKVVKEHFPEAYERVVLNVDPDTLSKFEILTA